MNKKLLVIIAALVLVFFSAALYLSLRTKNNAANSQEGASSLSQIPVEKKATLVIDFGDGKSLAYDYVFSEDKTAFDLLQEKLAEQEIALETQEYEFGILIKSINGYESTESTFWIYNVNDQPASVGADKYILKDNDIIQFNYTASG